MLTKISIRLFKRFESAEIELGNPVVFVGPNDSGKTTALQALALWDYGLRRWLEKRSGKPPAQQRTGVALNRRDLVALPIPDAKLLWHKLHVRETTREGGKSRTSNVRIDVLVEGVNAGGVWTCGLEFDFANEESIYCRPLRLSDDNNPERMAVPEEVRGFRIAYLPPLSGLASNEPRLDPGAVNVLIGEGRTAEVLRNLLFRLHEGNPDQWNSLKIRAKRLFGADLQAPIYVPERGEITMTYVERHGTALDLASSGRGMQQTLLVLTYLSLNPGAVLLLDEPDAHLEILRQRQIYQVLTDVTREVGSQVIIASHSEVMMNEAADRDVVVAFLGRPHRIDDRGMQVVKALKDIGFEQYYQAEQKGFVLYLEGSTDLAMLREFARTLRHPAADVLDSPFVHYVGNQPSQARHHFFGIREAKKDLVGFALFDRLPGVQLQDHPSLIERQLQKRELENYLAFPEALLAWARQSAADVAVGPLFEEVERDRREMAMQESIEDFVPRAALRDACDAWWHNVKATDEFLDRLFPRFFERLGLPNLLWKTDYHVLARYVPESRLEQEIREVLDQIMSVAQRAIGVE